MGNLDVAALLNVHPLPVIEMQHFKQAAYQLLALSRADTQRPLLWLI
jgi:hypothetical protein